MRRPGNWYRVALALLAVSLLGATGIGIGAMIVLDRVDATLAEPISPEALPTSTVVLDRNGKLLRPFAIADGRWRLPVSRSDVDPRFLEMLIGYEDRRFAEHGGVDVQALARAAGQFVLAGGRIVSGGSTLTMQVARLIEEAPTRSAEAKLRQIALARKLEKHLTKDEILTLYLMLAPYGGNLEGVRAASLSYFGKEPTRLTIAEAALLVALPQSPEARRPDRDPAAARAARDRVLDRMIAVGVLDAEEANAAKSERVPDARRRFPMLAAHLAEQAAAAEPARAVHRLTIDRRLQTTLEGLARDHAEALDPSVSIAIVVANHDTGEIIASVGSPGLLLEGRAGHVDMTQALRSPGSTLKPLIYGLAFEAGLAHPESLIEDRPTGFAGYAPQNFDGIFRGTVTVREALAESLNIPAIVVLDAVGPARFVARLKRAGIAPALPTLSTPGLAIGLGGFGITLRDLVQLYATIARGGGAVALHDGVHAGDDAPGAIGTAVLAPTAAWYVGDILADVVPPANGSPGLVAYKTGTSYGYRDAWAIGFDGRYVVGIWVGRANGTPVPGLSGMTAAAPILFEAFGRIGPRRVPLRRAPAGTLTATTTAGLPLPLRRFRHPGAAVAAKDETPQIAFPQNGVAVDLGIRAGDPAALIVKVRNGIPPFTYFANGQPFAHTPFGRTGAWHPDGSGYVTLSVVDADGQSDRVTVFVE